MQDRNGIPKLLGTYRYRASIPIVVDDLPVQKWFTKAIGNSQVQERYTKAVENSPAYPYRDSMPKAVDDVSIQGLYTNSGCHLTSTGLVYQ